jgi:hypothetical protein
MNPVDFSPTTMEDTLTVLIQNETLLAPLVSTVFVFALLSVLGLPVVCVLDEVAGAALYKMM